MISSTCGVISHCPRSVVGLFFFAEKYRISLVFFFAEKSRGFLNAGVADRGTDRHQYACRADRAQRMRAQRIRAQRMRVERMRAERTCADSVRAEQTLISLPLLSCVPTIHIQLRHSVTQMSSNNENPAACASPAWHPMWTTASTDAVVRAAQEHMKDPRSFGGENWDEVGEKLERAKADMRANKEMIALFPHVPEVCGNPRCGMPVAAGTGYCPCKQDMQYCSKQCQKMDRERHSKKCTVQMKKMPTSAEAASTQERTQAEREAMMQMRMNELRAVWGPNLPMGSMCESCTDELPPPERTEKSIPDKAKGAAAAVEKEQRRLCIRCDKDTSTEGLQYTMKLNGKKLPACRACVDEWFDRPVSECMDEWQEEPEIRVHNKKK